MAGIKDLGELVERYYNLKSEMDSYKKQVDTDNLEIKKIMSSANLNDFGVNDLVAHYKVITTENFDEVKLLKLLKQLGITRCIKTKEYVDMDVLEDCIYNGELDAVELQDCKIVKTQERLIVSKKKEAKNDN